MFDPAGLEDALALLGDVLADRGQVFDVVVIGGGGLQLLGVITRPTRDLDLVAVRHEDTLVSVEAGLPAALGDAVDAVARVLSLDPAWMNGGPSFVLRLGLPDGFLARCQRRQYAALGVSLASRVDQIHLKLYAAADDRPDGKHHRDLQRLAPTEDELRQAAQWARSHDPSPGFATMVEGVFQSFGWRFEP